MVITAYCLEKIEELLSYVVSSFIYFLDKILDKILYSYNSKLQIF